MTARTNLRLLKLGQLAVDHDFMGSDFAGLFAHSVFGAMPRCASAARITAGSLETTKQAKPVVLRPVGQR